MLTIIEVLVELTITVLIKLSTNFIRVALTLEEVINSL